MIATVTHREAIDSHLDQESRAPIGQSLEPASKHLGLADLDHAISLVSRPKRVNCG